MKEEEIQARLRGIELAIECRAFYEEFVKDVSNNISLPYTGGGHAITKYSVGNDSFIVREKIAQIWAKARKKDLQ